MNPAAFLATIIEHPQDDGPRLVYADWLEERAADVGGTDPRVEFIRVGCELARLGEPRVLLGGKEDWVCALIERGGPNYYEADSGLFSPVGSRVDVNTAVAVGAHKWKNKIVHGLLVRKVNRGEGELENRASIVNTFTLKRDELSVPFPTKNHAAIRSRSDELLAANRRAWDVEGLESTSIRIFGVNSPFTYSRGFRSTVICRWEEWCDHHRTLRAATPLELCKLTSLPPPDWSAERGVARHEIWERFQPMMRENGQWENWLAFLEELLAAEFGLRFELPPANTSAMAPRGGSFRTAATGLGEFPQPART